MNGKQRVLAAFHRERADRVPLDYSANPGIHRRLADHFHASDYEAVLRALDVDFRAVGTPYAGPSLFPETEGRMTDPIYGFRTRWVKNQSGGYWDFCDFPLQEADDETIAAFPVADPDDFDYSGILDQVHAQKEFAVFAGNPGVADILNGTGRVMGMEDTLVHLVQGHEPTLLYVKRVVDMQLGMCERILHAGKGKIDFFWMGEDLGTQHAPMISPAMYRRVLRPFHQRFIDLAKSFKLPVMIHTCGSSSWAYEDFIEMGIDAVDTLQPEAAGMSPQSLAERFGGRLSFHGCISTAGALAGGTPEAVGRNVRDTLDIMMPTRSYMLSPTHMIQDNTPVENVIALYDAARAYGVYP